MITELQLIDDVFVGSSMPAMLPATQSADNVLQSELSTLAFEGKFDLFRTKLLSSLDKIDLHFKVKANTLIYSACRGPLCNPHIVGLLLE